MIEFDSAQKSDESEIIQLLKTGELPFSDISNHIDNFILAKESGIAIGAVGLEEYDENGLLRSLIVSADYRNRSLGADLYDRLVAHARSKGVKTLYLLTTSANLYFARCGFERVDRQSVPEKIKSTAQFTSLCPTSSICMRKSIA